MKYRAHRRDFLIHSLQSLGAFGLGASAINTLLGSIYNKAFAAAGVDLALNPNGYRYVFVSLAGAPPRWMFDMLTTPNGASDPYVAGGFGTGFEISGTSVKAVNQTFEYKHGVSNEKKLYLPPVWGFSPNGAKIKFTEILPHTLFVRGMDMEINNHGVSNARQVAPITGGRSLHGVIADQVGSPVAMVNHGASSGFAFSSAKGFGAVRATGSGNPITALLTPFKSLPNSLEYRSDALKPVVEQFLDRIDSYAKAHRITDNTLREAHESADYLMRLNIDQLANDWDPIFKRYNDLITEAIHPKKGEMPGIFDKAIPFDTATGKDKFYRYDISNPTRLITLNDYRDMVDDRTTKPEIARQFALTEFLLLTGISSTLDLSIAGTVMNNVNLSSTARGSIIADQHGVGIVPSIVTTTLFYRGLLAAMSELVSALKQKNLFDKTIIHISSEFNRIPRADGSGSDHGVSGSSATLISGMFNEVAFIGNVKKTTSSSTYPGSWGLAANWTFEDQSERPIKVNDVARTITAMTNSADIVANGYSLVKPSGNGLWVPKKSGGANV